MTSHPDDESMFFGPMLLCRDYHQEVHLLCLSNGDADGLGAVRTKELEAAVEHLGVPAKNVRTLDRPELRDGMDELWPAEAIEEAVLAEMKRVNINTVVTFDEVRPANRLRLSSAAACLASKSTLTWAAGLVRVGCRGTPTTARSRSRWPTPRSAAVCCRAAASRPSCCSCRRRGSCASSQGC